LAQNDDLVNSPPPTDVIQKTPSQSTTTGQASNQPIILVAVTDVDIADCSRLYLLQPLQENGYSQQLWEFVDLKKSSRPHFLMPGNSSSFFALVKAQHF
jgi:hypothetical protein